jgi:hypothetical protein
MVHRDLKEIKALKVQLVIEEPKAFQVLKEAKAQLAIEEPKAFQVLKVQMVIEEPKALQVLKVLKVQLVIEEPRAFQVLKVLKDPRAQSELEPKALKEFQDQVEAGQVADYQSLTLQRI